MFSASERISPKLLLGGERNYQFSIVNCRRLLPFLVPNGRVLFGPNIACSRDFGIAYASSNSVCTHVVKPRGCEHVVPCVKLYCKAFRANIYLFHHFSLLFDDLQCTIYLQFNHLISPKGGKGFTCTSLSYRLRYTSPSEPSARGDLQCRRFQGCCSHSQWHGWHPLCLRS